MALISFVRWLPSSWMAEMASVMVSYSFFAWLMADCCSSSCVFRESILWLIPAFRISSCSIMASKRCALPLVFARELRISIISFFPSSTAWAHSSMLLWMLSSFSCSSESSLLISRSFVCRSALCSSSSSLSADFFSVSSWIARRRLR